MSIHSRSPSIAGILFVVVSASAFALQGLFARLAYEAGASTPTVGLGRFGLTAVVLWLFALSRWRLGVFPLRLPGHRIAALLALGGIGYFLGSLAYLGAVTTISVSLAGLLLYTYPAIATLLAFWLGREHLTRGLAVGLAVALLGVAVTLGIPALSESQHPDGRGVLLVLLSALLYGAYIVGSERALPGVHAVLAMAYIATGAALSYALLTLITGTLTVRIGLGGWGAIGGMAMVSTVIAAGALLAALRRLGPARAAILSTLEPPLTVIFAAIILGERLDTIQLVGGLVILAGVLVVIRERRPEMMESSALTQ